jgi:hypothetical protein
MNLLGDPTLPTKCNFTVQGEISVSNDTILFMRDSSNWIRTVATGGCYSIYGADAGTYTVSTTGRSNCTPKDALKTILFSIGLAKLDSMQQILADVNGDKAINSTDALMIMRHFVDSSVRFPVESLIPPVRVTRMRTNLNLKVSWFGEIH